MIAATTWRKPPARMQALTYWRPWPTAILEHGKACENRPQPPPRHVLGQLVAIHAGLRYEAPSTWPWGTSGRVPTDGECPTGIVGTALVGGWLDRRDGRRSVVAIDDVDAQEAVQRLEHTSWYAGPVGILLLDVRALATPLAWPGRQGWWSLDPDASRVLRESVCPDKQSAAERLERAHAVRTGWLRRVGEAHENLKRMAPTKERAELAASLFGPEIVCEYFEMHRELASARVACARADGAFT